MPAVELPHPALHALRRVAGDGIAIVRTRERAKDVEQRALHNVLKVTGLGARLDGDAAKQPESLAGEPFDEAAVSVCVPVRVFRSADHGRRPARVPRATLRRSDQARAGLPRGSKTGGAREVTGLSAHEVLALVLIVLAGLVIGVGWGLARLGPAAWVAALLAIAQFGSDPSDPVAAAGVFVLVWLGFCVLRGLIAGRASWHRHE